MTQAEPCNDCQTPIQVTEPLSAGDEVLCYKCMVEYEKDEQVIAKDAVENVYRLFGKRPML